MAEGARLESVFRGNSNLGSNPSLSASLMVLRLRSGFRLRARAPLTPAKRLKFESRFLRHCPFAEAPKYIPASYESPFRNENEDWPAGSRSVETSNSLVPSVVLAL